MNIQQTSLPRIARMVLTNLDGRIKNEGHKDLTVVDEIDPDLPETYADSDKLTQVLTNLLDNAYQYTPDGGKITMSVQMDDEKSFLISVADTGIGIPKKYQGRVFDRFFRNDDHTLVIETPGTGLGLALVKELVEMHNGHIWLESREGEGTTFFVQLPLVTTPPVVVEDETTVTEKEAQ
jgi:signal transduction histidine kinase